MATLLGATVTPLDAAACAALIAWAGGGREAPEGAEGYRWLLAHLDAGVIWGRFDRRSGWVLSSTIFPEVSPPFRAPRLQTLRLFGPDAEALIWRTDQGPRGRILHDGDTLPKDHPGAPFNSTQVLIGDRRRGDPIDNFTLVTDATGARHAVPINVDAAAFAGGAHWPLRLHVRNYFEEVEATGAVRIAASRLCDLKVQPPSGNRGEA